MSLFLILGGVGESNQGQADADADWMDELNDEEDSAGEDSDDEGLNSKLCTFTQTQKEFMNQHWYHCHTCKMVDGVGVCTVCAKVIQFFRYFYLALTRFFNNNSLFRCAMLHMM